MTCINTHIFYTEDACMCANAQEIGHWKTRWNLKYKYTIISIIFWKLNLYLKNAWIKKVQEFLHIKKIKYIHEYMFVTRK